MKHAMLIAAVPVFAVMSGCGSSTSAVRVVENATTIGTAAVPVGSGPADTERATTTLALPNTTSDTTAVATSPAVITTATAETVPSGPATATTTAQGPTPSGPITDEMLSAAAAHIDAVASTVAPGDSYAIDRCPMGQFDDYVARPEVVPADLAGTQRAGVTLKQNDNHGVFNCYFDNRTTTSSPLSLRVGAATASPEEIANVDASFPSSYTRSAGGDGVGGMFYIRCTPDDNDCDGQWIRGAFDVEFEYGMSSLPFPHTPPDLQLWLAANIRQIVARLAALDVASVVVSGPLGS